MAKDANTETMNISLPRPLKRYVDGSVTSGIYGSASEFVREAIREKLQRDQDRQEAKALLAGKLIEGLDSGKTIPFTDDHFKAKKRTLAHRAGKTKRG